MRSSVRHRRYGFKGAVFLIFILLLIWSCGDPPTGIEDQVGSILVFGLLPDSSEASIINIALDDDSLGNFSNPHLLEGLFAGTHLLQVISWDTLAPDTVEQYIHADNVPVATGITDTVKFVLSKEGPYESFPAPDFSLYNIDTTLVTLSDLEAANEIVVLYFFEST